MDNQSTDREGDGSGALKPRRALRVAYILVGLLLSFYAIGCIEAVRVLQIWQPAAVVAICGVGGLALLAIGLFAKREQFAARRK